MDLSPAKAAKGSRYKNPSCKRNQQKLVCALQITEEFAVAFPDKILMPGEIGFFFLLPKTSAPIILEARVSFYTYTRLFYKLHRTALLIFLKSGSANISFFLRGDDLLSPSYTFIHPLIAITFSCKRICGFSLHLHRLKHFLIPEYTPFPAKFILKCQFIADTVSPQTEDSDAVTFL